MFCFPVFPCTAVVFEDRHQKGSQYPLSSFGAEDSPETAPGAAFREPCGGVCRSERCRRREASGRIRARARGKMHLASPRFPSSAVLFERRACRGSQYPLSSDPFKNGWSVQRLFHALPSAAVFFFRVIPRKVLKTHFPPGRQRRSVGNAAGRELQPVEVCAPALVIPCFPCAALLRSRSCTKGSQYPLSSRVSTKSRKSAPGAVFPRRIAREGAPNAAKTAFGPPYSRARRRGKAVFSVRFPLRRSAFREFKVQRFSIPTFLRGFRAQKNEILLFGVFPLRDVVFRAKTRERSAKPARLSVRSEPSAAPFSALRTGPAVRSAAAPCISFSLYRS